MRVFWIACFAAVLMLDPPAEGSSCPAPEEMSRQQHRECVRNASLLLPQPTLTREQIVKGPDFNPADPTGSDYLYFTGADKLLCFFKPHYAYSRVKGKSLKFRCWQMFEDRTFYSENGGKLPSENVEVRLVENSEGLKRGRLCKVGSTECRSSDGSRLLADEVKVKYLMPAFPNHNTRYNEVFTEIAATRIMWVLGFQADHVYPIQTAECVGCDANPFKSNQKTNIADPRQSGSNFPVSSVERETGKQLEYDGIEAWSWNDANSFYTSSWTRQQRVEFDAYRLALRLINYHNKVDQQNRLICNRWQNDDDHSGTCEEPMILVQDVGSAFGKPKSFIFSTNPRGNFKAWESQTVFKRPDRCELRHTLGGDKRVFEEARQLLLQRLEKLDRSTVEAIFETARFHKMDQQQRQRLQQSGVPDVDAAALKEWTDTFMARIQEVKSAQGCKP